MHVHTFHQIFPWETKLQCRYNDKMLKTKNADETFPETKKNVAHRKQYFENGCEPRNEMKFDLHILIRRSFACGHGFDDSQL